MGHHCCSRPWAGGSGLCRGPTPLPGAPRSSQPLHWCFSPRTRLCCTASRCASSCRRPARSCPTRCTSTTPPAVSSPVSPRKSLLPEKVRPLPHLPPFWAGPALSYPVSNVVFSLSSGYPETTGWSHRAPGCAKLTAKCCGECRPAASPAPQLPASSPFVCGGACGSPPAGVCGMPCLSHRHLSFQGAGEPMDLGELVGMTPEIIQKVGRALPHWECRWALPFTSALSPIGIKMPSIWGYRGVVQSTDSDQLPGCAFRCHCLCVS